MNRDTAEYINTMMLDISAQISDSVGVVKERCSAEEAQQYIKPVAHIAALMSDVFDIVHEQYPDLKPEEFKD